MRQVLTICALLFPLAAGGAMARDSNDWATGPRLEEKLAAPLGVSWQGTPLARALDGLSQTQSVAIVRDRRVDPDQSLRLAIDNVPLSVALEKLAASLNLGYSQLGPVAYLGPARTAQQLRTLAALRTEEARKFAPDVTQRLLDAKSWAWDDLTEPRALLEALAAEAGVEVRGADQVPHDLWPAADLPPMTWVERLTLLAAEFDLTFTFSEDGKAIEFVPLPADARLARTYPGGRAASSLAKRWASEAPGAEIRVEGETIHVLARVEDHQRISTKRRGAPARKTSTPGKEVYQLAVQNAALDKVVAQLAGRLDLNFSWDRAATEQAGIASDQLVTFKVEQADLDALLTAVFANTGLEHRRKGRSVVIRAAESR